MSGVKKGAKPSRRSRRGPAPIRTLTPQHQTHGQRPVTVVHPLANRDAEIEDPNATVVADVFNLNRRPGEIYLAV